MNYRAVLFMLISTFSLSLSGLFSKMLTGTMSTELLTFSRLLIPAIMLMSVAILAKLPLPSGTILKPIVIRALCIVGCQFCFIRSLEVLSLVEGVVLFATGPLFIPVLEKLFFKVQVKTEAKFALIATFTGVLLLTGDTSGIQIKPELLYGLAAGMFNAGSQVSLFRASKGNMAVSAMNGWTFLIAAFCVIPVFAVSGLPDVDKVLITSPDEHWWVWAIMAVFSTAIVANQIFRSKAYKLAESNSQLAPLIYTNLLFTVLWQYLFFNESYSNYQIVGIALIVIASLMNTFAGKIAETAASGESSECLKTMSTKNYVY